MIELEKVSKKQLRKDGVDIEVWSNWGRASTTNSRTGEVVPVTLFRIHMGMESQMTVDLRYIEVAKLRDWTPRRGMVKNVPVHKLTYNPEAAPD